MVLCSLLSGTNLYPLPCFMYRLHITLPSTTNRPTSLCSGVSSFFTKITLLSFMVGSILLPDTVTAKSAIPVISVMSEWGILLSMKKPSPAHAENSNSGITLAGDAISSAESSSENSFEIANTISESQVKMYAPFLYGSDSFCEKIVFVQHFVAFILKLIGFKIVRGNKF